MKRIYLLLMLAIFYSCSVEDDSYLEYGDGYLLTASAEVNEECTTVNAGDDSSKTISESKADAFTGVDQVRNLYLNLIDEGVSREGEFYPSIWNLINSYTGAGTYSTIYTITEGDCSDSVELTIVVIPNESSDPTCNIRAGADASKTITQSKADAFTGVDQVRNLYLNLLDEGVSHEGEFDPSIWNLINSYTGPGTYSTIYTITEGDCSDSVELTIVVVPNESSDPTCNINAGADASKIITHSKADAFTGVDQVRNLYLNLLDEGVSREGNFDPSIWNLINSYTGPGTYTTTYTISEGDCSDSVELSIIVVPDNS